MWRSVMWTLGLLVLVPALPAQEKEVKGPPGGPRDPQVAEQYQAMQKDIGAARSEIVKKFNATKSEEEREKLRTEYFALPEKFAGKYLELAEKHPKDGAAFDALVWIMTNVRGGKVADKAAATLAKDHIDKKGLVPICIQLQRSDSPAAEKFLRAALEKSPHDDVKGHACYSLAKVIVELAGADPKRQAEAEKLFERVAKDFAEVEFGRGTLADMAKDDLYVLKNLAIGKLAPQIEAEDIDGETFKLSDYRGKIVMLDFWGHW